MNIKPVKILAIHPYKVTCLFDNGESKQLEMKGLITDFVEKKILSENILLEKNFSMVKIGEFGQLVWDNFAKMKNENNELIDCDFDVSPEYVYANSK